jgi:outer membrane protein
MLWMAAGAARAEVGGSQAAKAPESPPPPALPRSATPLPRPQDSPAPSDPLPRDGGVGGSLAPADVENGIEIELSLSEAVRRALHSNLDIRIAHTEEEMRRREVIIEQAVYDPFFNLSASYSKNRRPTSSFLDIGTGVPQAQVRVNPFEVSNYSAGIGGRTILGTSYTLALSESGFDRPLAARGGIFGINPQEEVTGSIQIVQPILKGAWYGYNSARIRIASNNQRLSQEQLELTASEIVLRVEQAYWQLVFALKNYESKTKALAVAAENLENARKKKDVGTFAAIDVTTAQSQHVLRKVELNEARLILENSRVSLLELLNHAGDDSLKSRWRSGERIRPYESVRVVPTSEPDAEILLPDRDAALQTAFAQRPEYRQVAFQVENQQLVVDLAENELLPDLDFIAGWNQHGLSDTIDRAFSSLSRGQFYSWSVGLQLQVPFSRRGPRNAYLRAQDELRRLILLRSQLENRIIIEVDESLRSLTSLQERLQDLEERVRLQDEILDAERKKLNVGKSIAYTVSLMENDLVESQAQALRARADYEAAKAGYYRAIGMLLEHHGVETMRGR